MEVIKTVFTNIWNGLETLTIPIVNCSLRTFLLALLLLNIVFGLLNFFLGKHGDSKGDR